MSGHVRALGIYICSSKVFEEQGIQEKALEGIKNYIVRQQDSPNSYLLRIIGGSETHAYNHTLTPSDWRPKKGPSVQG